MKSDMFMDPHKSFLDLLFKFNHILLKIQLEVNFFFYYIIKPAHESYLY